MPVVIDLIYEGIETDYSRFRLQLKILKVVIDLIYEGIETLALLAVLDSVHRVVIDLIYEGIETFSEDSIFVLVKNCRN